MDIGDKLSAISERAKAQSEGASGATINASPGIDLFGATKLNEVMAEDRELYMLAQTFCDQAIRQGKQDAARKAIALMIACEGAIHVVS